MIRIQAISDIHGMLPFEPCGPCEVLIIAGDICPDLRPVELQGEWLDKRFRPWLKEQPAQVILGTWGNHDLVGQTQHVPQDLPILMRVDESVSIRETKFHFTPWVPNLGPRWAFSFPEDVPSGLRRIIPNDIDILVSHGPPRGYSDEVIAGPHVGSITLLERLNVIRPKVTICGHIHEGRGVFNTGWDGLLFNVSSLDRRYEPYDNRFTEIYLP